MSALLEVRDLTKTLPGMSRPVLDGVNFTVMPGSTTAILGRSGSGKSTLLSLLALFDRIDSGVYRLDGQNVTLVSEREACQLRSEVFGFVFQRFFLLKNLTAEQNVCLSLLNGHRVPGRSTRARMAREALDRVGIASLAHRRPPALSGGEQQRVAIARALVRSPKIILADEPTGALDEETGATVIDLLRSLSHHGTTVIMVTHDHSWASVMDRVVHLHHGRVAGAS
ncbi:MAG: ABC transporter ATP-binding protein [Actinomycetota bacterium]